jgi:hypothetical protein
MLNWGFVVSYYHYCFVLSCFYQRTIYSQKLKLLGLDLELAQIHHYLVLNFIN